MRFLQPEICSGDHRWRSRAATASNRTRSTADNRLHIFAIHHLYQSVAPVFPSKLESAQRIRNDVEHYHCNGRERQVQQALANAADIIRQLLTLLDLTPVEALGQ